MDVLFQPAPSLPYTASVIHVTPAAETLTAANHFCYLASIVSRNALLGDTVNAHLAKASAAFVG